MSDTTREAVATCSWCGRQRNDLNAWDVDILVCDECIEKERGQP